MYLSYALIKLINSGYLPEFFYCYEKTTQYSSVIPALSVAAGIHAKQAWIHFFKGMTYKSEWVVFLFQ